MRKKNIIHVGMPGIPFSKNAAINRCLAIYVLFSKDDYHLLAINNKATHFRKNTAEIPKKGKFLNINYIYTTPTPFKPNKFFKRRYYKFLGRFNEYILLLKKGFRKEIDIMFFYPSGSFFDLFELFFYRSFSKLFDYKLISHYVEYRSSFDNRKNWLLRINDIAYDHFSMFFVDGIIPISEFLIEKIHQKRKKLPILKITPVVNFQLFSKKQRKSSEDFFLFVGNTGYFNPIDTILDSFEHVAPNSHFLYLVLHGNQDRVRRKIENHPKKDLIKIFSGLDYSELIQFNIDARALLIPLFDVVKDKARFPNKIAEYLASGNPVITTNYGEIVHYFKDEENALVAENNDPFIFSKKMEFIINYPERAIEIGKNGHQTGLKYFDNNSYQKSLIEFIKN